jgi:hypothetical protein
MTTTTTTLWINFFTDGGALLETVPNGETSMPVRLPPDVLTTVEQLLTDEQNATALARLFLAGVYAAERVFLVRERH